MKSIGKSSIRILILVVLIGILSGVIFGCAFQNSLIFPAKKLSKRFEPNAQFVKIKGAGHNNIEGTVEFKQELAEFFKVY